ncbi:beta strand repeat-containing protein [Periweissella ghanensis]|uniref:Uncharacterized protein n=1 Tax=Periweissella ghanensis TaxID=467997 RepID=A0ABM8ZBI1_9LACO|nr:KxYKxGKxW signal peptide domain-containing protein [Periweissella ghanensis]MCM0601858.1 KxYKxGKxW signal peptide domain-containing protein [Periweissella ghanensis]CAH0418845.1 hypothetical protein WGH24286_01287 [Periweissella ghanensis]
MEEKRHYKLYKSGKNWVVASIAAITVLSGSGLASTALNVHAATPVATAKSNINFAGLKAQLVWSNAKASNASIYSSATGKTLVAKLQADIKTANGYINNPKSATQAKVTAITTALRNDGVNLNNEVANILNGQLFWSNKKVASDYVTAQGKTLFAQLQTQLATANSYVKNPSLATPANVMAITSALHQTGLDLYASKVTDLKAQLVWSNAKKAADYTTEAGKKAFATLTADIKIANGYVADPEFATPAEIATITDKLHQDGLDLIASNKAGDATQLNKDITTAAALVSTDYTKDSFATFQTALTAAQKVAGDKTSTQEAIDAADKALTDAENALVNVTVDVTVLQGLINQAPTSNGTSTQHAYTSVSYATFATALATAKQIAADPKSTQSVINAEVTTFKAALGQALAGQSTVTTGLQTVTGADDSQLQVDLATANVKLANASTYTTDSVNDLRKAVIAANGLYDATTGKIAGGKTQANVDAADLELSTKINALKTNTPGVVTKDSLAADILSVSKTNNATGAAISLTNLDANGKPVYAATDFNAFKAVYDKAVSVNSDATATQSAVDTADSKLKDAINTLNSKAKLNGAVDLSQIKQDIASAKNTIALAGSFAGATANRTLDGTSHVYTQVSFDALTTALANISSPTSTNQVFTDTDDTIAKDGITAATVTAADTALTNAIKGLTPVAFGMVDKTQLQQLVNGTTQIIAKGNLDNLGQPLYTSASFAQVQVENATATTLLSTVGATQAQIDAEYATLNAIVNGGKVGQTTYAGLQAANTPATTDVTALTALVADSSAVAKAYNAGKNDGTALLNSVAVTFTDGSYSSFVTAVKAANADLQKNTTTANSVSQSVINADYNAVQNAYNALQVVTNKQLLNSTIASANAYKASDYSAAAFSTLTDLIAAANAVSANAQATQSQVNTATSALNDQLVAMTSSTTAASVDQVKQSTLASLTDDQINALKNAFTVNADKTAKFTSASKAAFDKAYSAMNSIVTLSASLQKTTSLATSVTLAQLTQATTNLVNAYNALVKLDANYSGVDDAQLKTIIASASAYNASDYTTTSFKALSDALTQANTDEANGITAKQVTDDSKALSDAIKGLVPANKIVLQNVILKAAAIANDGNDKNTPVAIAAAGSVTLPQAVNYNNDLAVALKTFKDSSATPAQISSAASNLQADINGLAGMTVTPKSQQPAPATNKSMTYVLAGGDEDAKLAATSYSGADQTTTVIAPKGYTFAKGTGYSLSDDKKTATVPVVDKATITFNIAKIAG